LKRKALSAIILTLLLIGMLALALNIQPAKADGTIRAVVRDSDGPVFGSVVVLNKYNPDLLDYQYVSSDSTDQYGRVFFLFLVQ